MAGETDSGDERLPSNIIRMQFAGLRGISRSSVQQIAVRHCGPRLTLVRGWTSNSTSRSMRFSRKNRRTALRRTTE
jgi:hypothetical protein